MIRQGILLLIALICATTAIYSQTGTYNFLRIDVSARSASLNGSFVSMIDDPNVQFYNPASLGTLTRPKIAANYVNHVLDINGGGLSYGQYIEGIGSIGAGITYIDYGTFNRTDESMNVLGTFGASELALIAGISARYDENILVGINAKYIYSSIAEYRSSALAADIGILYEISSQNITLGASILNLGKQLNPYINTDEPLPLDIVIGVTKRPEHLPVFINLNFHRLNESGDTFLERFSNFTVGAEFIMSESVRLRLGYNNKQRKEMRMGTSAGLAGFSIGAGFIFREYQLDYGHQFYGKIDGPHWLSLGIAL